MKADMQNLAILLESELRAMCIKGKQLYVSGNMKASIIPIAIAEDYVDVVIATPYASYTNTRGYMSGWIEKTVKRVCRCFASNNNVEDLNLLGSITYGGF